MEFLQPRVTIENTDQPYWVVRLEHTLSDCEHIDLRLKVARDPQMTAVQLTRQVMAQARDFLSKMVDKMDTRAAG